MWYDGNRKRGDHVLNVFEKYLINNRGFTVDDAKIIMRRYRKDGLVEFKCSSSAFYIKHGTFLDQDILEEAIKQEHDA